MSVDVEAVTLSAFAAGMELEPDIAVSEWADSFRILSPTASAEPGKWRTSRTPYLREVMDALSANSPVQRVVIMAGAQTGKTECGNNWIGYVIHHAPAPMMMVQPTVEMAMRASKQRIAPMIEATDVLRDRVKPSGTRNSGNTLAFKEFDGGILAMTGANSASGLRMLPIRFLFMDEVDAYPGDLDGEGDPVALAENRTVTFTRRKVLMTSTPTTKGLSRIEQEFLLSDQRRYFVPCPHCGAWDFLRWERIRWEEGRPETAALKCSSADPGVEACGALIEERFKSWMLERGEWRATAQGDGKTRGYHIPSLLSPAGWKSWAECAFQFVAAKDNPAALKTWVNTVLGETWEERGESLEAKDLAARLEKYPADVPEGVGVLTAAVDVQGDRLEVLVKGWGAGEESWVVAFTQIHGDPSRDFMGLESVWRQLDLFLGMGFKHQSGRMVWPERVVVDSGGANAEQVYRYCKARQARGFFPIKGGSLTGRPLVERPSTTNRYRIPLFVLCVDTGKDLVSGRLRIPSPGPGYIHLPDGIVDQEFMEQLTAEKAIRRYDRKRGTIREWVKVRERNEAFDLEVYSLAALHIAGQPFIRSLALRAEQWNRPPEGGSAPATPAPAAGPRTGGGRRPGSWVNRW